MEKTHSSLLCQEGRTGQGGWAVPWDVGQGCLATGHKGHQSRGAKGQGAWAGTGWVRLPQDRLGRAGHSHCHGPVPTGTEEVSLEIPANILESSQRAHINVMGKGQARGAW